MEIRVILRGALAGFWAGVLGFIFARIFAEPVINKAIAYESGRDAVLAQLNHAAGRPIAPDGPEIFSRTIQSTVGIGTGIIAFSTAMGALVAVAAIGHTFTITTRGQLYLTVPSLGNLAANVAHQSQFGYARAATETPQPITNILWTSIALSFGALLERFARPAPPASAVAASPEPVGAAP